MGNPITPFWIDGFEHGRITAAGALGVWDAITATPAIVTTPVRTDTRSLEIVCAAAARRAAYNCTAGQRVQTMGFAVRYAALPTADHVVAQHVLGGNDGQIRFVNASDRFATSIQNTDTNVFGPNPIVINTWYLIVMETDASTGTTTTRARCFDATTGAQIGTEASSSGVQAAGDFTTAGLGTLAAETFTAYYDDWVLSQTDGDYEDWPHLWRVQSLIPNADGTHNIAVAGNLDSFTGTAFDNTTTTAFSFIDHRPLQAANTADNVIRQDSQSATDYVELLYEDRPAGTDTPLSVRSYAVHVMSSTTGTPTGEARLMLSDSTEVMTTGAVSVIGTGEDPGTTVTLRKRMTIPPTGGWTSDQVNGLKIRLGFNNIAADENFIDAMLEVLLVTGSLAPAPPIQPGMRHMVRR